MRILVISDAVTNVEKASGEEWSLLLAKADKRWCLTGTSHASLVDYDVFFVDNDRLQQQDGGEPRLDPLMVERLAGGGCVICFGSPYPYVWLPSAPSPRPVKGDRVEIKNGADLVVQRFFEKYLDQTTYKAQFNLSNDWIPTLLAMNGYPVAGYMRHGQGMVMMLPEIRDRSRAVRELLDNVIPVVLPSLRKEPRTRPEEAAPEWVAEFPLSQLDVLDNEIQQVERELMERRARLAELDTERRDVAEYQGLLWYEGKPLEAVVERALNCLGIDAHPRGQIDLVCPLPAGGELYIEVEGTTGAIQVRKGGQLLRYISDADDPSVISGAIIGNPFRKEHPGNRPPTKSQAGLFSPPLSKMAEKYGWGLITTSQLFDWIRRHLEGDTAAGEETKTALGLL